MSPLIMVRNAGIAALLLLAIGGHASPAFAQPVPNPVVIGPIPVTAAPGDPSHHYPFFSTNIDLASVGYIEEEYFIEGTANRYDLTQPLPTASIIDSGHPYRTRLVVRRPASPSEFNGTVLLEWQNDTLSYDVDALWIVTHDHLVRRGYAWVGVSAFRAGIHTAVRGLRAWSPARYDTLGPYGVLDVTDGNTLLNDELSFDIFSQAAMAVKTPNGMVDPMGGLHVQSVVGVGISKSANLGILRYYNSIQPLASVVDAFLSILGSVGTFRTDLDVKVFRIWSETEAWLAPLENRQPDSDHLRTWEVAGTAHFDWDVREAVNPLRARDLGIHVVESCELPPFSRIPFRYVGNAAIDRLVQWTAGGVEPPSALGIEVVSFNPLPPYNVLARDSFGNALGGIRLSQHVVATATNTAVNAPYTTACVRYGTYLPFDEATLDALYPNHGAYVDQVARVTADNRMAGYIVVEDAAATIRDAAGSNIGKR